MNPDRPDAADGHSCDTTRTDSPKSITNPKTYGKSKDTEVDTTRTGTEQGNDTAARISCARGVRDDSQLADEQQLLILWQSLSPDLRDVVLSLPGLPDETKQEIMAIVRRARGENPKGRKGQR